MPVHFNSFISDNEDEFQNKLLSDILTKYTENADDIFVSNDKTKIHMTSYFKDIHSKKNIGKIVITLIKRKDSLELVDADVVLLSDHKTKLHFGEKLEESSEANEYYLVNELNGERHFDIETVNRYVISNSIEDKNLEVYLSAFPFRLDIFDNEIELNSSFGLNKEIDIPGLGKKVLSMDLQMMADGRAMTGDNEPCSFIIGKVEDFKEVETNIADNDVKFMIIDLNTAVGNIPVAVNGENFNLSKLKKGALIGMLADIKADLKI